MTEMQGPDRGTDAHHVELDARDWIVRLTSGSVSEADLEAFRLWRDCRPEHRAAFERESLFWHQLQAVAAPAPVAPAIEARHPHAFARRRFLAGGAAIAATALVGAPHFYRWWSTDFVAPVGEQAHLVLPDGSTALLNSGSALRLNYGPQMRLVALTAGEAEFTVKDISGAPPFRLAVLGGNTQTNAARFSARVDDDHATITLSEKQAIVFGPADEGASLGDFPDAVRIAPNEQTTYRLGKPPTFPVAADMELSLAWQQHKIIFEGKAFEGAVAEVGRYLREPVLLRPGIDRSLPVSGVFSTRAPLAALEALARTQALAVRRLPGVAILVT